MGWEGGLWATPKLVPQTNNKPSPFSVAVFLSPPSTPQIKGSDHQFRCVWGVGFPTLSSNF